MRDLEREFAEGHITLNQATRLEEEQVQTMRPGIEVGEVICVRGHVYREEQLRPGDFTMSRKRGWCPIPACRMPLRRVALVDRNGKAWTETLV